MDSNATIDNSTTDISTMAEGLVGSEIIKLANEVNDKIKSGEQIFNLTIGDFNPEIFPIPEDLANEIKLAYDNNQTNYPSANGIVELRNVVSNLLFTRGRLEYNENEILIAGGGRPLIYAIYKTILDPGDTVIFPVPSWNNNHYCHLSGAFQQAIHTTEDNNFMLSGKDIEPYISKANLISLCSPLNPTGTTFTKEGLMGICELILNENKKRSGRKKPVYLLFDQIYWQLTYGNTTHYNPVAICPEMREYTIFVDGMSKAYAATGVRIGWGFGPEKIINKMKAILGHIGAWAPKAEQVAASNFLRKNVLVDQFLEKFKHRIEQRLTAFYNGFKTLKSLGHNVDAIAPQAALYLTVKIDLIGLKTNDGQALETSADITQYLLNEAKIALVPFYAFGTDKSSRWYRLSVGTAEMQDIERFFDHLRNALAKLNNI